MLAASQILYCFPVVFGFDDDVSKISDNIASIDQIICDVNGVLFAFLPQIVAVIHLSKLLMYVWDLGAGDLQIAILHAFI